MRDELRRSETRIGLKRRPFYHGWWMVGIGMAVNGIGSLRGATTPVFFLPVSQELGVSRAALSLIFSIARLEGGLEGPVSGWLIDRFGPRLPTILGTAVCSAGYLVLATTHSYWGYMLIYLGIISPGSSLSGVHAMHALANLWFVRYRTRVLSIFSASIRMGTALATPLVAYIVVNYGWRTGAVFAALVTFAVTVPAAHFIRRSPESMGLLPDGADPQETTGEGIAARNAPAHRRREMPTEFALREALRTPAYWIIAFSTTARLSLNQGVRVHVIPIFVWKGLSEQAGANLLGLMAFLAVPLILTFGWLGDRFSKGAIMILGQMGTVLAMLVVVNFSGLLPLLAFTLLMALGESTAPVNHSIVGDYFGRKAFATLNGLLSTFGTVGLVTPVFAGFVFDRTESYSFALLTFAVIAGAAAFLLLFLRKPAKAAAVEKASA